MTNETIIKMVQAGVPTETIVRTIQSAESFRFGTLPGDLTQLQQANVPDEVIRALAARINWPGTAPLVVVHPLLTPPQPQPGVNKGQSLFDHNQDQDDHYDYLHAGAREIVLTGMGFVSHPAGSTSLSLAGATFGEFLTRGNMIGGGVSASGVQDVYFSGVYRYFVKTGDPKLFPFAGASMGWNVAHIGDSSAGRNYLTKAEIGLRYFPVRHIAIDMSYNLQYLHSEHLSFGDSAFSAISVGFAHVF